MSERTYSSNFDFIHDVSILSEWRKKKVPCWICSAVINEKVVDVSAVYASNRVHAIIIFRKFWSVLGIKIFDVRKGSLKSGLKTSF